MGPERKFYLAVGLAAAGLLGYGYYLQFAQGLQPCPLCIFQRVAYLFVLGAAVIGLVHGPARAGRMVYGGLILAGALAGAGIAGRQVWLQHLPPEAVPACGPGLDFMLEVFPLTEVLRMAFTGSGECAEVDWTFLGLSIAEWSLACFLAFGGAAVWHLATAGRERRLFRGLGS